MKEGSAKGRAEEEESNASASDAKGAQKSYVTILDEEISEALDELERPTRGLLLSGLSAGLDIGFSALLLASVMSLSTGELAPPVLQLLKAGAYSIGFVLVIFGRSELFTEHTTLAFLPVLGRQASLKQLARLWGLVYGSNLVGAAVFAGLLVAVGPSLGVIEPGVFGIIALELTHHPSWVIFLSAVLGGWLMGLVSWLVTAGRDTISEIFFVIIVTGSIGFAHLHHCILGSVEVLAGLFAGEGVTVSDFARFLVFATLGNVVGGVIFVALVKYGHATQVRRGMRHRQ